MKNRTKNKAGIALAVLAAAALLTGCGNTKEKAEQEELRIKGIEAMTVGHYEDAINSFQKALDLSFGGIGTMEIDICMYKAEALYLSGDSQGAMDLYNAMLDYKKIPEVEYLRGNLYFAMGDSEKGIRDFDKALADSGNSYEMVLGVNETMTRYGMADRAMPYMTEALEYYGESGQDHLQKGRIALEIKDLALAEEHLNAALNKGEVSANFYLAKLYSRMGDQDSASSYLDAYMESGRANARDLMEMGEECMNNSEYEPALRFFLSAMELEDPLLKQRIMRNTIIAYEYTGDFVSAANLASEYVEAYPDDYKADEELIFLQTRANAYDVEKPEPIVQ